MQSPSHSKVPTTRNIVIDAVLNSLSKYCWRQCSDFLHFSVTWSIRFYFLVVMETTEHYTYKF